ncbi:MAG: phosphate ABC transporter substrate-binding protein [Verrucomicrobia bacterium]|nr:phosphate ABC transporter substrate-binding protein [Verrucomicrobiota bacterium]MCH8514108.1 phosphate ABC transporter substrate-binding protein [Kiritimatiellia bacterium]
MKTKLIALLATSLTTMSMVNAQIQVDENLPEYKPVPGISGNLNSVGSDSMNNMMTLWAEGFLRMYPNVQVEIEGKGSGTAPPAMIAGTAAFGPMSREMRGRELDAFENANGYPITELPTSIDMLAVYVNKDNPIEGLSLPQVDAIFSSTRRGGLDDAINRWGEAGMTGAWANRSISIYGRNSASGTYGFFKENALFGGDFRDEVKEQPGSSSVVQGVASEINGIGYSGIGYRTPDVRAIALAREHGDDPVPAEAEFAYSGEYPLARFLYVYVNHRPGTELDPLRREFIKYMFSKQGQMDVVRDGYLPVDANVARRALQSVGIEPGF